MKPILPSRRSAYLASYGKAGIGKIAGKPTAGAIVSEMARQSLTGARHNQNLTREHMELILIRVAAGSTVRAVCLELGVASGSVYQRAIDDRDFGADLEMARTIGARSMFDMMIEIAFDDDIPTERAKLCVAVLDRLARTFDRSLSDRRQIDIAAVTTYVVPADADDY